MYVLVKENYTQYREIKLLKVKSPPTCLQDNKSSATHKDKRCEMKGTLKPPVAKLSGPTTGASLFISLTEIDQVITFCKRITAAHIHPLGS